MSSHAGHATPPSACDARIELDLGRELRWHVGEVARLTYRYATDRRKPYIHPLRTSSGETLTALEPADHVWHRGLWFAWKYINGINYWEETPDGLADGRTIFHGADEVLWRPEGLRITTRYRYTTPSGAVALAETRTLQISLPSETTAVVDWDATFTAPSEVTSLDRTPINAQTPWGGYAGLSFRASQEWRDVHGLDSEGRRDTAIEHQRARWVHITGVGGDGRRAGLAMLDHPDNLRYPSFWRYIDTPGFFYINPSPLLAEPYVLAPGALLRLRYRVLALEGDLDGAALDAQHAAFVRGLAVPPWDGKAAKGRRAP
jgi:hypothetical protein